MSHVFRTSILTDGLSPILGAILSVRRYLVLRIYPVYRDNHYPLTKIKISYEMSGLSATRQCGPLVIHEENRESRAGSTLPSTSRSLRHCQGYIRRPATCLSSLLAHTRSRFQSHCQFFITSTLMKSIRATRWFLK